MKSILAGLLILLSCSSFAYTLNSSTSSNIMLKGESHEISLKVGQFTSGEMYDKATIGKYTFQINPYFSAPPVSFLLSGRIVADAQVLILDVTREELKGTRFEGKEDTVLEQLSSIKEMLMSGDSEKIKQVMGTIVNFDEINCSPASNAFIVITLKDNHNESKFGVESFGNCTTLHRPSE